MRNIFFKKFCPYQKLDYLWSEILGVVVQLVGIPACHAGKSQGFQFNDVKCIICRFTFK